MTTLARLERQLKLKKEQAPAPAPSLLGEAIEQIIRQQVEERVAAAMEKQLPIANPRVQPYLQPFTDKAERHDFPAPSATTKPPRDMTMHVQRDELGRIATFTVGNDAKFELQRDARGRTVRVVQLD